MYFYVIHPREFRFHQGEPLPDNALLVVIDAVGLYDNIPPKEGVQCVGESLEEQASTKVSPQFITRLLQLVLEYSVFEFNQKIYQQQFGTSMGCKPAPPYANIFMARKIDKEILKISENIWKMGKSLLGS